MRSFLRIPLLLLVTAPAVFLSGCLSGGGDSGDEAQIRLLNVSTGYQSLDVYSNNDNEDDDSDELTLEGVASGTVSDYAKLDADTYSIKFKRNGVTSTLATQSGTKLTDDSHITYIAYGSSGHFAALAISDDEADADGGKSNIRLVNTSEAGAVDVYLTDESVELDDAEPVVSSVASGSTSSLAAVDSGTYRLRVTGAGDTTDLRFDVSGVAFESKAVVSIILTATQGGVLVNALILPQEGSLTTYTNTKARVRGAVGISSGTAVTATMGGVKVLSTAAVGVIGSRYEQVEAGTVAVALGIDGTAVTAPSRALVAGGDYTLLVWTDSGGATQTTLITDDNHVPSGSSKVKIRAINGMSLLGGPITLSVDYSPIAEEIVLGQASAASEVTAGTDFQLDITDAMTGAALLNRSSVTLQDGSVYTFFLSGGAGTAVGTLRKDR